MHVLGIDVGGSGIKAALVDTASGQLTGERQRIATPAGFRPEEVVGVIARLVADFNYRGPVGVGFPALVVAGIVGSAPTSHGYPGWDDYDLARAINRETGCPTTVLNDADVAGVAEMSFGVGRGEKGVVMLFTLGTGVGSAVFVDGKLVPNTELGHIYLRGRQNVAEYQTADRARKEKKLGWKAWAANLDEYFNLIERVFTPQLIIIGGGVSKQHHKFIPRIHVRARVVPAALRNQAGIVGAAMGAAQMW